MHKTRIEAFSDGVIAIIITVMILALKTPDGINFSDLYPLRSAFLCYCLSFIYLAIYWNNHHHLFQAVTKINGKILWANLLLLFWLSLIPFVTTWAGENHFASVPTACYGFVLLMAACSYNILTKTLIAEQSNKSILVIAIGKDFKGKISIVFYILGIAIAFWLPYVSFTIYILVASIWFVPDKRIEKLLENIG